MRRVPAADRPGRGGRRGDRERPGARARPRLGRLRRPPRESHARARPPRRARCARDEAPVHAAPARRGARRGVERARRAPRRHARRLLLAPQPGRAGVRGDRRRSARRVRPASRRRAARVALRRRARARGSRPAPHGHCRRRVRGRRRPLRVDGIGPRVGEGGRVRRRRVLPSAPASSARDRGSGTEGSRRPRRRTQRRRSADGRSSPRGCRMRTSANATAGCRTTRKPCSRCVSARLRVAGRATPRAGARPATACRSRTWGEGPTRIPRSSPPPTPLAGSRGICSRDGRAEARPGRRPRHVGDVRRRLGAGTRRRLGGDRVRQQARRHVADVRRSRGVSRRRVRGPPRRGHARDEDLGADARGGTRAIPAAARVVRARRRPADPQPRQLAGAPRVDRGGTRGRPRRAWSA